MNGGTRNPGRIHLRWLLLRRLASVLRREPIYTEVKDTLPARRGRSLAIRVVDCGSCSAAEQEILAIFNPVYDAGRLGIHLVTSPRQADLLLLTGPLTRNMEAALLAAFAAMPEPRRVVTVGDEIVGQGIFGDSYAVLPLPDCITAARVAHVPGDPPAPEEILAVLQSIDWR